MRRGLLLLAVCLPLGGCWGVKNSPAELAFVRSVDSFEKLIGPRYKAYIEKDAALAAESKETRLKTVEDFRKLIDQRKAHLEESAK